MENTEVSDSASAGSGSDVEDDNQQLEHEIPSYTKETYWEERYAKSGSAFYDWYVDWSAMEPELAQYFGRNAAILQLGCGNSELAAQLCEFGCRNVTSVDVSPTVIEKMRKAHQQEPYASALKWAAMDARKLSFADSSFDVVLEKGLLDAFDDSDSAQRVLAECQRVLKPGGHLIVISHSGPSVRWALFASQHWELTVKRLRYSASALLIRVLRRELNGQPLSSASPEMVDAAVSEVAKLRNSMAHDASVDVKELEPDVSPVCFCYVARKRSAQPESAPASSAAQQPRSVSPMETSEPATRKRKRESKDDDGTKSEQLPQRPCSGNASSSSSVDSESSSSRTSSRVNEFTAWTAQQRASSAKSRATEEAAD